MVDPIPMVDPMPMVEPSHMVDPIPISIGDPIHMVLSYTHRSTHTHECDLNSVLSNFLRRRFIEVLPLVFLLKRLEFSILLAFPSLPP